MSIAPRSPHALSSLSRLHPTGLHLCCHFDERGELIHFARCSRTLRSNCDAEVAWKHVLPMTVWFEDVDEDANSARERNAPLLRHCGLALHLSALYLPLPLLLAVYPLPHIRELHIHEDACRAHPDENAWVSALQHPSLE